MGGSPWHLSAALVTLRAQLDAAFPNRDRRSDGSIGDAAHASRPSDHNPDADGSVDALDVDADLVAGDRSYARRLADELAACAREGRDGGRLLNIVYADQVASGTHTDPARFWRFRGSGYGHRDHIHISVTDRADRDGSPWPLPILEEGETVALSQDDVDRIADAVWRKAFREYVDEDGNGVRDPRPTVSILYSIHRDVRAIGASTGVDLPAIADAVADELGDRLTGN